jgi:hypothetical protein
VVCADGGNLTAGDPQRGFQEFLAEQSPAAFDNHVGHDAAP